MLSNAQSMGYSQIMGTDLVDSSAALNAGRNTIMSEKDKKEPNVVISYYLVEETMDKASTKSLKIEAPTVEEATKLFTEKLKEVGFDKK